jgi:zinc protease
MGIKRFLFWCVCWAFASVQASPEIQHWQTSNGARVLFAESHELPIVQVRVVFDAGAAKEPGDLGGIAGLTNRMLAQGTGDLDADTVAAGFEDLGAEFSTSSLRDMALLELRSLSDRQTLEPAIALAARVLARPSFPAKALERERQRALLALQQERQSPGTVASKAFYASLYRGHPYANYPGGTQAGLNAIGRDDLVAFHQRYYVAANAVVAVVGDLSRNAARALVEDLVSALPRGERAEAVAAAPAVAAGSLKRISFPSSQSHLLMGQPGIRRGDEDYYPLYVGNYILGGGGLVSRLSENIREKNGLAYSVYSYFMPMRAEGPFMVGLQTKNAQLDRAMQLVNQTIDEFMDKGPTEKELLSAKRHITGGFPLRLDSNQKIAEYLAVIGFYHLPLDYLQTFNARIEKVTVKQVQEAFRRRVDPNKMITVVVGGDR